MCISVAMSFEKVRESISRVPAQSELASSAPTSGDYELARKTWLEANFKRKELYIMLAGTALWGYGDLIAV